MNEEKIIVTILITFDSKSGHTEKIANYIVEGINYFIKNIKKEIKVKILLKKIEEIDSDILYSCDALVVGSPVYWSNMSSTVKKFFEDWQLKFGVWPELKMKNKIGAAFATGGHESGGGEITTLSILGCMLNNQMIVLSGDHSFGIFSLVPDNQTDISESSKQSAFNFGKRITELTIQFKIGKNQLLSKL